MSGLFIRKIKTNLKDLGELELTPCTLVVGKNGTGKTSLVDAISLALTGEARTSGLGKAAKTLWPLRTDGDETASVEVELSDGSSLQWVASKGRTQWSSTNDAIPELPAGVFVDGTALDMLLGDPKKLRRAILLAAGSKVEISRVEKDVAEEDIPALREVLKVDPDKGDTHIETSKLLGLLEVLSAKLKTTRESLRSARLNATSDMEILDEHELAELEELEAATADGDVVKPGDLLEQAVKLEEDAEELTRRARAADPSDEQLAELEVLQKRHRLFELVGELGLTVHDIVGRNWFTCPLCRRDGTTPEALLDGTKVATRGLEETRAVLDPILAAQCEATVLRDRRAELLQEAKHIRARAQRQIGEGTTPVNRLNELKTRRAACEAAEVARSELSGLEAKEAAQVATRAIIEKACESELERQAAVIEKRMNRFLPKNIRAKITTKEGDRAVCVISASWRGGPHRAFRSVSGAERMTLLSAFAFATIAEDAPAVRVLMVDDLWLDAPTLRALLKAVASGVARDSGGVAQAIVCIVEIKSKKPPDGWSLLQLPIEKDTTEEERAADDGTEPSN